MEMLVHHGFINSSNLNIFHFIVEACIYVLYLFTSKSPRGSNVRTLGPTNFVVFQYVPLRKLLRPTRGSQHTVYRIGESFRKKTPGQFCGWSTKVERCAVGIYTKPDAAAPEDPSLEQAIAAQ
jgi:hypothetical protein